MSKQSTRGLKCRTKITSCDLANVNQDIRKSLLRGRHGRRVESRFVYLYILNRIQVIPAFNAFRQRNQDEN